ncbi:MAG: hypothetical protein M0Z95_10040 [Actinomycetota bacterium]|jgi:hypothetical protein|nr:hypothetical protein [Actinomycetota bacterium]
MAPSTLAAAAALDAVDRARARTRVLLSGHWFASVVFGVILLWAMPFYVQPTLGPAALARTPHCQRFAQGFACSGTARLSSAPFGRAFNPQGPYTALGRWSTLYWAIAVVVGFAAVLVYYHLRARKLGVQGRHWPAVLVGLAILGLVMWANSDRLVGPGDFSIRGTSVLVVIAIGFLALSVLERSRPFMIFAAGFFGLALLSTLYDLVNLFTRLQIAGPFLGTNGALPNLILPGAYLLVGGLCFLAARGWRLRSQLSQPPA